MLLVNSISNTKKFFQKTIDNVKSFLSIGSTYQRLPKTPPFHPFSCGRDSNEIVNGDQNYNNNNNELDYFYTEFTHQWDSRKNKTKNKAQKKPVRVSTKKNQHFSLHDPSQKENCNMKIQGKNGGDFDTEKEKNIEKKDVLSSKRLNVSPGLVIKNTELCSRSVREKRLGFVVEKLKELEVVDKGNVDHKLDFEEFLHYYSRLTCPAYLDIVDKFLMEMSREFFGSQVSPKVNYSRHVLQALKV